MVALRPSEGSCIERSPAVAALRGARHMNSCRERLGVCVWSVGPGHMRWTAAQGRMLQLITLT